MKIGGLVFRFYAEIYRLDPVAMAAVDPPGPATTGFDDDFQEPRLEAMGGLGKPIRREMAAVRLPCQVEPDVWDQLRMFDAGNSPSTGIVLTMHFDDLARAGLVTASGEPTLRAGDRLGGLYDLAGALVQTIRNPPGLYIDEFRQDSFGLSLRRPKRQLLLVHLKDRQVAFGATA